MRYHLCLSVRGALRWGKKEMRDATKWITRDDGSRMTVEELRTWLEDELSQGHEVYPMCPCDNFDWKKGCQGHEDRTKEKGYE